MVIFRYILTTSLTILGFTILNESFGQLYTTSTYEIENIKEAIKKEDFNSLSILLKDNRFTITKSNFNFSRGSQYIIAEIECEKKIPEIQSNYSYSGSDYFEILSIYFKEDDNYKELWITRSYTTLQNDFLRYFYNWKNLNWTFASIGEPNRENYFFLLSDGKYTPESDRKKYGYEIGEIGSFGTFGNQQKKILNDSIDMREYGSWYDKKPGYKKMIFRNVNENLGTLCIYSCELSSPLTSESYHLSAGDTAYRFYLSMTEFYPKYSPKTQNKSGSNFIKIPLLKYGKTYYITVTLGGKKKKYVLDSGASDVTIDEASYKQLLQSGIIKIEHKLPDGEYQIADGSTKKYKRTIIPEIQIDNIIVENVVATIVPIGQPLLLGKSFLDNFRTWKIDNSKSILIVEVE